MMAVRFQIGDGLFRGGGNTFIMIINRSVNIKENQLFIHGSESFSLS